MVDERDAAAHQRPRRRDRRRAVALLEAPAGEALEDRVPGAGLVPRDGDVALLAEQLPGAAGAELEDDRLHGLRFHGDQLEPRERAEHITARLDQASRVRSASSRYSCSSASVRVGSRRWASMTSAAVGTSSSGGQASGLHSLDRTKAFGQWA